MLLLCFLCFLCVAASDDEKQGGVKVASVISEVNKRHLSHKDNEWLDFQEPESVVPQVGPFYVRMTLAYHNGDAAKLIIHVRPDWSPREAHRFKELVEESFFDDSRFFRVISGLYGGMYIAQFGMPGDPETYKKWQPKQLLDDPILLNSKNRRGTLSFVGQQGKNSRAHQIFINFGHSKILDGHYNPFAEVSLPFLAFQKVVLMSSH